MTITEMRHALKAALDDVPGTVEVALGPTDYDVRDFSEMQFRVRVYVGPRTTEHEELLDRMLDIAGDDSIKSHLDADDALNARASIFVSKTAGHQLYSINGHEQLGSEWIVRVLT